MAKFVGTKNSAGRSSARFVGTSGDHRKASSVNRTMKGQNQMFAATPAERRMNNERLAAERATGNPVEYSAMQKSLANGRTYAKVSPFGHEGSEAVAEYGED